MQTQTPAPTLQDKLRDPIWQSTTGLLALLLTVVSIWLAWTALNTKALNVEVISQTPLLTVQDEAAGRLQIAFDGKPVEDVTLSVIKVTNSGNAPILDTDFQRPLTLSFGETAEVLSAEVVEMIPPNIGASVKVVSNTAELNPILLNSGNTVTMKILLTRYNNNVTADARIVGVSQLYFQAKKHNFFIQIIVGFIVTAPFAFITYRVSNHLLKPYQSQSLWKSFILEVIIPTSIMAIVLLITYPLVRKIGTIILQSLPIS
ncbi:MAG TPA: hypothetical protein VGD69_22490 [Herpetosiphonaceae bacterium]